MDGKISHVTLVVTNKDQALRFYTEKAGFEKKTDVTGPEGYRFVTVAPSGPNPELALWEVGSAADPEQKRASERWAPARSPPIIIAVPDCRKAYEELSARGVDFTQAPKEHPWGVVATFQDPDGNLFSLSQLRGWPASK
jgi:predicted enzyme related to lactoylglutathione lyase